MARWAEGMAAWSAGPLHADDDRVDIVHCDGEAPVVDDYSSLKAAALLPHERIWPRRPKQVGE